MTSYDYNPTQSTIAPSSWVFRASDRIPMDYQTVYREAYIAKEFLDKPKSNQEKIAAVAEINKSKLPFFDKGKHHTTDTMANYVSYVDTGVYKPESELRSRPIDPNSDNREFQLGYYHEPINSTTRVSYTKHILPKELSREERLADIQRTRAGVAILKNFGDRRPEPISTMEAGNRHMLAAPSTKTIPGAGGNGSSTQNAAELAKEVHIQLGTHPRLLDSDYRSNMIDYRTQVPEAANPYKHENRVHEVDPSANADEKGVNPWVLKVQGADGELKEIHKVKSAIDFGHDDYIVRSCYMDQTNTKEARLTSAGGWHTNVASFVPTLRPRFEANKKHPAYLKQQEIAARVEKGHM
jgi:hypothetical protein